jgi:iron complex outermembrane receptor protein
MTVSSTRTQHAWTVAAAVAFAIAASAAHAAQTVVAASDSASEGGELQEVVVTGTRQGGLTAAESPAPIQILSAEALQAAAGNPDLMSTLAQIVPSLTMEAFGADMAGQTLLAKLRGLSPNQVLVLVNGKRRHTTANIAIDTDQQGGSGYTGGAGVDLNFIPLDAIDHIEVLTDGAAAQYGTDAIAGVINIILKKQSSGVTVDGTYGNYFNGGGNTGDVGANAGFEPLDGSYFNLTGEVLNHGHSDQGAVDPRAINDIGTYPNSNMTQLPGYPFVNHIYGDAESHTKLALFNAGFQLGGGVEFYAFGSYGDKHAASYENYRPPERIGYTNPVTMVTTYPYLFGFNPQEATAELDWQTTGGIKGVVADWNWDVSSSYGGDKVSLYTLDSIGNTYPVNGEPTPSNFYDGFLQTTQWVSTIDLNRDFDVGMAGPLNVAGGVEYRRETYTIGAGIPDSWQAGGAQSYAGINPVSASSNDRKNEAVYIDLAGQPIQGLRLDAAGRYEHYSDFGSATVGKLTGRYDFTPEYAVRATISNGFRAPTLAEAFYTSTNVGPSTAQVSLAPDSAAGKLLGLGNGLTPEKSLNYSLGFVFRPLPAMSVTLDLYQITITNRIVETGSIYGQVRGVPTAAAGPVNAAIAASGNQLDPAVLATGTTSVATFANGIDTRTQGADLTFQFPVDYALGHVNYSIGATYNDTTLTRLPAAPAEFAGQTLYDVQALSDLTTANPKWVMNLGANWTYNKLSVNLLEKIYGPASDYNNDDGDGPTGNVEYFKNTIGVTPITNLDIGYQVHKYVKLDIGAINLFNRFPPNINSTILSREAATDDYSDVEHYTNFSPFGINGGFYYAKATISF